MTTNEREGSSHPQPLYYGGAAVAPFVCCIYVFKTMKMNRKVKLWAAVLFAVIWPAVLQAQAYFEPMAMNGVELMAMVKHGILEYEHNTLMAPGLYELKRSNTYQPQKDSPVMMCNPSGGCVYHDGKLYVNDFDDSSNIQAQKPHWKVYDAQTWELLSDTELKDNAVSITSSLAYDPTTDMVYGFQSTFTENFLVKVDPKTGEVTRIKEYPWSNKYTCIACNKQGQLYCIYFDKNSSVHYLARIRKTDGRIANVGVISAGNFLPDDPFVDGGYSQSLFFNNATDQLYWMYQSASAYFPREEYTPILKVNTSDATASMCAYLQDGLLVSGAFFMEPRFTAPAVVEDFSFVPTTADRLNGSLHFTVPATDYVGNPLSGTLTVRISEGGQELLTLQAQPGEQVSTEALGFANGQHELQITVANVQGEDGPTSDHKFYAGFDVPKACQNIQLKADGLITTLTWEPPVEGVSGAPIDPDDYTYTVVRYPYEETVATGLKELKFSETHPANMTRYVYLVKAVDSQGREGRSAYSNNLIVGTPLDVPYGGAFTSAADLFNYYTIVNANGDNQSWTYDSGSGWAAYVYNPSKDADDWLISPPINYKKGHKYIVTFNAYSSNATLLESMEVRCGKGRTPESQGTLLLDIPEVPAVAAGSEPTAYRVEFTAPEDSVYHFSFHVYSPAYQYYLFLNNIRVEEDPATGITDAPVGGETLRVTAGEGILRIANPGKASVRLYNASGLLLGYSADDAVEWRLPAGIYIVAASDGIRHKVAVR